MSKRTILFEYPGENDEKRVVIERNVSNDYHRGASCDTVYRIQNIVWFIISIIELLLVFRFIFLALGARLVPFTAFIYSLSEPFIAPFSGIFRLFDSRIGLVDTSTLVAIIMYLIVGWITEVLVSILFSPRNMRC